jgi:hypothetical protein
MLTRLRGWDGGGWWRGRLLGTQIGSPHGPSLHKAFFTFQLTTSAMHNRVET